MIFSFNNYQKSVNLFWIIIALCGLNLLIMHYYLLFSCHTDAILDITSFIDNLLGITFDIVFLFFVLILITRNNVRISLGVLFSLTWLWSFVNIIYSRFFYHYLSFSAIIQSRSLFDGLVFRSIEDKVYLWDFLFFLYFLLIIFLVKNANFKSNSKHLLIFLFFFILVDVVGHAIYCISVPQLRYTRYFLHRIYTSHIDMSVNSSQPIYANYSRGSIRPLLAEIVTDYWGNIELSTEQVTAINTIIDSNKKKYCYFRDVRNTKNVIFILVESLMSFTSELKIGNNEVTPFLNSLRRDSSVYYNGNVKTNVTIGESSDGQFIYMTGLLPLRSLVTVTKARRISLPGLPKVFGYDSRMIIPTVSSMWNQDDMCIQYGFEALYTSNDYEGGKYACLSDEQVFQLAIQQDKASHQPFFSVVLTISMHQPYTEQIDPTFPINVNSISNSLANYLNVCHYTDHQIEKYFVFLKESGLLNNSLVVIAADHPVRSSDFGDVSSDIPLYIVYNDGLPKDMWQGECNQLDVYTTLLDLLGCKSEWYGLGNSLVSSTYINTITSETWDASEWIIMSDFFSNR